MHTKTHPAHRLVCLLCFVLSKTWWTLFLVPYFLGVLYIRFYYRLFGNCCILFFLWNCRINKSKMQYDLIQFVSSSRSLPSFSRLRAMCGILSFSPSPSLGSACGFSIDTAHFTIRNQKNRPKISSPLARCDGMFLAGTRSELSFSKVGRSIYHKFVKRLRKFNVCVF